MHRVLRRAVSPHKSRASSVAQHIAPTKRKIKSMLGLQTRLKGRVPVAEAYWRDVTRVHSRSGFPRHPGPHNSIEARRNAWVQPRLAYPAWTLVTGGRQALAAMAGRDGLRMTPRSPRPTLASG